MSTTSYDCRLRSALTLTISVSTKTLSLTHNEQRTLRCFSWKFGVLNLSESVSNLKVEFGSSSEVDVGHERVAKCQRVCEINRDALRRRKAQRKDLELCSFARTNRSPFETLYHQILRALRE